MGIQGVVHRGPGDFATVRASADPATFGQRYCARVVAATGFAQSAERVKNVTVNNNFQPIGPFVTSALEVLFPEQAAAEAEKN